RTQSLLQDGARGAHASGFAFALALHFAQTVDSPARGLLEPRHGALHAIAARLRQAPNDSLVSQPAVRACGGNPHARRGSFHGPVAIHGCYESIQLSSLFSAVPRKTSHFLSFPLTCGISVFVPAFRSLYRWWP